METFEAAGRWWLPDSPDQRVVGILKYTPADGFVLTIPVGHLGTEEDYVARANSARTAPLVHGELGNGKAATLVDVACTSWSMASPGHGNEEHQAQLGFVGGVHTDADPLVESVRVGYEHLRDWVGEHPLKSNHAEALGPEQEVLAYRYEPLDDRRLAAGDGWELTLRHTTSLPMPAPGGFHVLHDCVVVWNLDSGVEFSRFSSAHLERFWRFLCFSLDRMVRPTRLEIRLPGSDDWTAIGRVSVAAGHSSEPIIQPFMLLSLIQLDERVQETTAAWLDFDGDLGRAISLLVGLNTKKHIPVDLRFLASAQALEAMSRVDAKENELPPAEFKRRLDVVAAALAQFGCTGRRDRLHA